MAFGEAGNVRGMSFNPLTNQLYVINDLKPGQVDGQDKLYRVNPATGATTVIGLTGRTGIQSLEFAPNGTAYGWDMAVNGFGLCTINLLTGQATDVNPAVGHRDIQGMAFAPDGSLIGVGSVDEYPYGTTLWKINVSTGTWLQSVSGPNTDIRGIAFIPEPVALGAPLMLMALGSAGRRRTVAE